MARGQSTFKRRDLTAAVKAVVAAGCEVARVVIEKNGKIVVVTGKPQEGEGGEGGNPWDTIG